MVSFPAPAGVTFVFSVPFVFGVQKRASYAYKLSDPRVSQDHTLPRRRQKIDLALTCNRALCGDLGILFATRRRRACVLERTGGTAPRQMRMDQ